MKQQQKKMKCCNYTEYRLRSCADEIEQLLSLLSLTHFPVPTTINTALYFYRVNFHPFEHSIDAPLCDCGRHRQLCCNSTMCCRCAVSRKLVYNYIVWKWIETHSKSLPENFTAFHFESSLWTKWGTKKVSNRNHKPIAPVPHTTYVLKSMKIRAEHGANKVKICIRNK